MTDLANTSPRDAPTADEIDSYLAAVARDDCYHVIRSLGAATRAGQGDVSAAADTGTVTELVQFEGANGAALGPFVRKRIDLSLGVGAAYEELFAAQQAGVRFSHLPRTVECYKTGRELVVVSEYVPGETLVEYVRRVGAGVATARDVVPAVCAAVSELHGAFDPPIVHRDLKPSNIIIARSGVGRTRGELQATLIDLGIARRYREDAPADTVRFGTRSYAPPEQYGFGQTSVRSDVYALGMIALFCVTGAEPQGQPTSRSLAEAGVPARFARAVLRATAFDPAQRYGSAAEFAAGFGAALLDAVAIAPSPTTYAFGRVVPTVQVADGRARDAKGSVFSNMERAQAFCRRHHSVALGHVWNVLLALIAAVFVIVATQSVSAPVNGQARPIWFSLYLTYVFCLPLILGVIYLFLDRKSLERVIPRVAARSRRRDARNLSLYLALAFVGGVIVSMIAG